MLMGGMPEKGQDIPAITQRNAPDFLGFGAQKCGTTWLYEHLKRHPEIEFPSGKELHFWDKRDGRAATEWLDQLNSTEIGTKRGEITPAYALLDTAIIREIAEVAPNLRLFYSIRNPIDRAWSGALQALSQAEMTIDEASNAWFIEHFKSAGSRKRGDYAACLSQWRSVFQPDQIHWILFDDLVATPRELLLRLAAHLQVEPEFFQSIPEEELREPIHVGPAHPLRPALRRYLTIVYRPQIEDLEKLLDRDLGHWLSE
jgi:hypothetical protein